MRLPLTTAFAFISFAVPAVAQGCSEGLRPFEHLGGTTCIPDDPQRIVTTAHWAAATTLIEVGANFIAADGDLRDDGSPTMPWLDFPFGIDYANSEIEYIGDNNPKDFEAIASVGPDLIISQEFDLRDREQLEAIAPTVFIEFVPTDIFAFPSNIADAAGRLEVWQSLRENYDDQIANLRAAIPEVEGATYTFFQYYEGDGGLAIYSIYGPIDRVLQDLGLVRSEIGQQVAESGQRLQNFSIEVLPQIDADFVFTDYSNENAEEMSAQLARLDAALPSWRDAIPAASDGRLIVIPRNQLGGSSFRQLNLAMHLLTSNMMTAMQ